LSTDRNGLEKPPPLTELHLHLEGAIPHPALWDLICKYGGDPSVPDQDALARRFTYQDFPHFIRTWLWKDGFLRAYEDFAFIAEAVARDLEAQQVVYAEAHFSPSGFGGAGLQVQEITRAVRSGLDRVSGIKINLIADVIRDLGPECAARTLREITEVRDCGVIGIGLGGSEQTFPPELYAGVYAEAKRLGFRLTVHAGEAAGAGSVWNALRRLGAERIGHGTRAGEDPALLDYLAEKQIPVEMCPLSNVRTGVVSRIEEHPIRRYFDRGLLVTVSTDDPKMFGNSLAEEFQTLRTVFGFSEMEIRRLKENSIRASWMEAKEKALVLASETA
jgi:adenosine deaminase